MFKIGEFSKLTQVSIRMLRYYDEVGILKPAEVDEWTGYRMYSIEQIPVLNKIIYLRDSGFQVSEIAMALEKDEKSLVEQLEKKRIEVEQVIRDEQDKLLKIDMAKREILGDKNELHYNISIKSIPSYQVLSLRKVVPSYYSEGEMWKELSGFAAGQHLDISSNTFSIYHDKEYKEQNVDIELCVPVKKMGKNIEPFVYRKTEPVSHMACTMVYGDFSNIAGVYRAFAEWLNKNEQYQIGDTTRQIVHRGPWNEENPQKYLTEIQIPLKKR